MPDADAAPHGSCRRGNSETQDHAEEKEIQKRRIMRKIHETTKRKKAGKMAGKYTPEKILSLLEDLPEDAAVSMMIRHSERELTDQDVVPFGTRLTPRGIRMAEDFGKKLPEHFTKTFRTSPVPRSRETLLHIAGGAAGFPEMIEADFEDPDIFSGLTGPADIACFPKLEDSVILGKPGAYVTDRDVTRQLFMAEGTIGLTNRYLDEGILPGFRPLADGTDILMKFLTDDLRPGNISINVSHDATVASLLGDLTGIRFSEKNWIPFIGGIVFVREKGGKTILYDGDGTWDPEEDDIL